MFSSENRERRSGDDRAEHNRASGTSFRERGNIRQMKNNVKTV